MNIFGRSFRPRGWAFALALLACAAGIALGNWQTGRAQEKRALAARLDSALSGPARVLPPRPVSAAEYALTKVEVRGEFVQRHAVLLDNRIRDGRPGFEVITPLRIDGSELHVLVNRGWIAAPSPRSRQPQIDTPAGIQRIEGLALERLPRVFEPWGYEPRGGVLQNLRLDEFRAASGLALQPVVIEQLSASGDGLLREWPRPDAGVQKHEMYALQWYSLAGLAVVLFVVLSLRREKPAAR